MPVETTAGSTLSVCAGNPPTYDAAGYATLFGSSAEEFVGEITDLGEFGREYALNTHSPVATRGTQKFKGSFNEGQLNLQLALNTDDPGQIVMKQARDSDDPYSFKITMQGGDVYYFQALVMGFKVAPGSVDNIVSASSTMEITTNSAGVGIVESLAS